MKSITNILWFILCIQITSGFLRIYKEERKCGHDEYECKNKDCINTKLFCNGMMDCSDNSDEDNCDFFKCLPPNYFKCSNNECIPTAVLCNGENDCADGLDEKNCTFTEKLKKCDSSEYQCKNLECISMDEVCNGVIDCDDLTDETIGCANKKCKEDQFQCKNRRCISQVARCDKSDDCGDNSDEESCYRWIIDPLDCTIENKKFLCKDRYKCLDLRVVCNNASDCFDESDENGECLTRKHCQNCTHGCFKTPDGPVCLCNSGYFIGNNNICEDINECNEFGICDQKCENFPGGYRCSCDAHYTLQSDGKSCKIKESSGFLVYSSSHQIVKLNLSNNGKTVVVDKLLQTTGVAVAKDYIYWTVFKAGSQAIVKSKLNKDDRETILASGLDKPEDLAIDWITMNVYFTDSGYHHIGVCGGRKFVCTILHNQNIDKPRDIAVSPELMIMFWTDWGTKPSISSSGMDGSNATSLVTSNLIWPNGIAVDTHNERLYWVDAKLRVIETIRLDGTDRRVVLSETLEHPFSVSVFENKLFWSDWKTNEIFMCNKFNGKEKKVLVHEKDKIYGMHVYHKLLQIAEKNPCANAECSDLCLLAPNKLKYTCACPDNKILISNKYTCEDTINNQYLLAGYDDYIYVVEPQHLGNTNVKKFLLKDFDILAVEYDARRGEAIIADKNSATVYSYNFIRTSLILPDVLVSVMRYDDLGYNLYYTQWFMPDIRAIDLNTRNTTLIWSLNFTESILDFILIPKKGLMFVVFLSAYEVHIDRISMDGSITSRKVIHTDLKRLIKLHYNDELNRLFLANIETGVIETINIEGNDRQKYISAHPASMASFNNKLFWSDHESPVIYWEHFGDLEDPRKISLDISNWDVSFSIITLAAFTKSLANQTTSPCYLNNGGCSHLCLISSEMSNKKVCACPTGLSLSVDNLNCVNPKTCSSDEYQCYTGECIPTYRLCDKRKDCIHGDDEISDHCYRLTCPLNQFLCHSREQCIDKNLRCNGAYDCKDKSDEICPTNCTEKTKFWCNSGECIDIQFRCDGRVDCKNGHDELECGNTTCTNDYFHCRSGQCIPYSWKCDGENDCTDGSDEMDDCTFTKCGSSEFACDNGKCINLALTCDLYNDCGDFSDEDDCKLNSNHTVRESSLFFESNHSYKVCNSKTEFFCVTNTTHCLPLSSLCNGIKECLNGIDEKDCRSKNCDKNIDFRCLSSSACIPHKWICDGVNDCGDHSDEDPSICLFKNATGTMECHGYQCKSGECISLSKVCDTIADCSDRSDENGECGIKRCANFGCSQKCHELPYKAQCSCELGYKLLEDGKTCVDIDECELKICSQNCTNLEGSFACSCYSPEYTLRSDHASCKATGEPLLFVIASDREVSVVTSNLYHFERVILAPYSFLSIIQIDVDVKRKLIYSLFSSGSLLQSTLNEFLGEVIDTLHVTNFAVDWITENLYLVELHSTIVVKDIKANRTSVIHQNNFESSIWSLAVDPVAGYLFWFETDIHKNFGKIVRIDCSGKDMQDISTDFLYLINQLTVDSFGRHLYFLDEIRRTVFRISYDGLNTDEVILKVESPIIAFTFFENHIYWVSRSAELYPIKKCKIFGLPPRICETIEINVSFTHFISIIQTERQKSIPNPCININCDGICVTSPNGPECLCHEGKISQRNQTCNPVISRPWSKQLKRNDKKAISTFFACFVIICFAVGIIIIRYYHFKPKSKIFHRFYFHNIACDNQEQQVNETESMSNELRPNEITIQNGGSSFLETLSDEYVESEFYLCHRTSRESLIKS